LVELMARPEEEEEEEPEYKEGEMSEQEDNVFIEN
jgi:hypothetical protein